MSDSYLIDGYNLIHALGMIERSLGDHALEVSRRRLLEFLHEKLVHARARITVVFDARHGPSHLSRQRSFHGMAVFFAPHDQTADDLIESLIERHTSPRSLVVISNDGRLQIAARRRHARAWSHTDMLDFLDQATTGTDSATANEEKVQLAEDEDKEFWLKEFGPIENDPKLKEFFDLDRFEDR